MKKFVPTLFVTDDHFNQFLLSIEVSQKFKQVLTLEKKLFGNLVPQTPTT